MSNLLFILIDKISQSTSIEFYLGFVSENKSYHVDNMKATELIALIFNSLLRSFYVFSVKFASSLINSHLVIPIEYLMQPQLNVFQDDDPDPTFSDAESEEYVSQTPDSDIISGTPPPEPSQINISQPIDPLQSAPILADLRGDHEVAVHSREIQSSSFDTERVNKEITVTQHHIDPDHQGQDISRTTSTDNDKSSFQNADSEIEPSSDVAGVMGLRVPQNTLRNNNTAMRRFQKFAVENSYIPENVTVHNVFTEILGGAHEFKRDIRNRGRRLKRLRDILREFAVRYRQEKNGDLVSPSTMEGYIRSINRVLVTSGYDDVDMYRNPIFTDTADGLIPVLNNHFANQQAAGAVVKHHNTLPRSDIIKLFDHNICDPNHSLGYLNRLILAMAICLGIRPTAMHDLTLGQFTDIQVEEETVITYTERIGSTTGSSKGKKGGIKYIKRQPVRIPIWNRLLLDKRINLFSMIKHYMSIRPEVESDKFFLQLNRGQVKEEKYFKAQHLGKKFFYNAVKNMCLEANITGTGVNDYVTNHGIRSSMISLLIEAGHTDSSIILRTGHTNTNTLARYHHLEGAEGLKQQIDLFKSSRSGEAKPNNSHEDGSCDGQPEKKLKMSPNEGSSYHRSTNKIGINDLSNRDTTSIETTAKDDAGDSIIRNTLNNVVGGPSASPVDNILGNVTSSGSGSINVTVNINQNINQKP